MAIRRSASVSLTTVTALLAMLWILPAVWCIERDGSIKVKTSPPCSAALPHCPGEGEAASGSVCTDVAIHVEGLNRVQPRPASVNEVSVQPLVLTSATDRSFSPFTASKNFNFAGKDRSASVTGIDLTTVLII